MKTIQIDFLIKVFPLEILSVGFNNIKSFGSGSFLNVRLQLFAGADFVEPIQIDVPE
jgi:hypothetical protein